MTTGSQNLILKKRIIFRYLSKLNAVKTIILFCDVNLVRAQTYACANWSKIGTASLLKTHCSLRY